MEPKRLNTVAYLYLRYARNMLEISLERQNGDIAQMLDTPPDVLDGLLMKLRHNADVVVLSAEELKAAYPLIKFFALDLRLPLSIRELRNLAIEHAGGIGVSEEESLAFMGSLLGDTVGHLFPEAQLDIMV